MATTTPARKRGPVARSEVNGKPKLVEFRGLKLRVPAKCPGEVLWDIGDDNISATLRTILGEAQYIQMRGKVADDGLAIEDTIRELTSFLNGIFTDTYGITPGE